MLEAGPLAFNFRSGPFAWQGLPVSWCPLVLFSAVALITGAARSGRRQYTL